ncbi:hypothetical protein [Rhodocyclus tenuis]|uniref:Flagellar assembly protein T N-terminal domain-containing protein n=1 Tax=Rhodocyclus tenuis TaxID=1066 RepID=A0A840GJR7_RHOTE|nr:hypothetical protein [Rhodocyclus tenuis]MBB4248409.1 hypothetical protein [Rhodocyclus tenuis]
MQLKKIVLALAACALGSVSATSVAETLSANGQAQVSVSGNGDLINARRVAREAAERDAVAALLRLRMNLSAADGRTAGAISDLATQLSPNLKTSFVTEGDFLTARTNLEADSAQVFDLARSLGLMSNTSMAQAKVVFLIDEYYGIATNLQPGQPLTTEVEYAHDKSSFSDKSAKVASASSAASSASSASRSSVAVAASDRTSVAGNQSSAYAARDQRAAAISDGYGGSAAAARDTRVAGAQQSSYAGSSQSSFAGSASSASANSASSSRQASYGSDVKNVNQQNDKVSFRMKQTFPDTNNAKPADGAAALISARLEQVVKQFGIVYTPERDLRVKPGSGKTRISEIERQGKFAEYTVKAGSGAFKAKYVVYGESVMSSEGSSPSGGSVCSGSLKLQSFNVDSGDGLVSGTINKRAQGSSDQDCRANLATAMATELAEVVGNTATRELQIAATQGQSFYVTIYSKTRIPPRVRREITDKLQGMAEQFAEDNVTDNARTYVMQAKGNFRSKVQDLVEDMADSMGEMKLASTKANGNRMVICVEGSCPKDF